MEKQKFDLNIEQVLENWDVSHAIREIIANALDEQVLTKTKDIEIVKVGEDQWHIKDFGRGLRYTHLTQNENEEKLSLPNLIGKFGVGLKDALATFDRHNVQVKILSKYGIITLGKSFKQGFEDITTLHAFIEKNTNENFIGTEFILKNCAESDIQKAKKMFLKFQDLVLLESTTYGEIYKSKLSSSIIYINGIQIAEEDNFLFSYNITSLNAQIKKALNRERNNVGRIAYTDRIKSMLLQAKNKIIINDLVDNLSLFSEGSMKDELKWTDVATHAVKLLNLRDDVVFITPKELEQASGDISNIISNTNKKTIFIPDNIRQKLTNSVDTEGNAIQTVTTILEDYRESF